MSGSTESVEWLKGPTAIAFVRPKGDAVAVAKALRDFARGNPNLVLKGGMFGTRCSRTRDDNDAGRRAVREVLFARLAGGFQAPLTKAAGLFQASPATSRTA